MVKFIVSSGDLALAIQNVVSVIPNKPNRDTLKNIKIVCDDDHKKIGVVASDLEIFARKDISEKILVESPGEILVPAQAFGEFIKSLGANEQIEISDTFKPNLVTVTSPSVEFSIGIQDLNEYPPFPPQPQSDTTFVMSGLVFQKLFQRSEFAAADKNSNRLEFTCICLDVEDDMITMMATDGHRLAVAQDKLKTKVSEPKQILVTPKALGQLAKMIGTEDVTFIVSDSTLYLVSQNASLCAQLIHASYPPVRDIIPQYETKISLLTSPFLAQLKKANLATDNNNTVRLQLRSDLITLKAETREQHKAATVKFPCEYDGKELDIAINSQQLIDALKVIESEKVDFYFREEDEKLLFTEPGFQYIVMPQEL